MSHEIESNPQPVEDSPKSSEADEDDPKLAENVIESTVAPSHEIESNPQLVEESPKSSEADENDPKIVANAIESTDTSSHEIANNLRLVEESPNLSKIEVDFKIDGERMERTDTSSDVLANIQIDNSHNVIEAFPVPATELKEDLRRIQNKPMGAVRIIASQLFDANEESVYQSEDVDNSGNCTGNQSAEESDSNIFASKPEQEIPIQRSKESFFKDRKRIVKYVVAKLTGFDIEVNDKTVKHEIFDPTSINDYPIVRSVFENQVHDDTEVLSSSSFSSAPEIDMPCQKEETAPQNLLEGEMNELFPIFDFIPAKSGISRPIDAVEEGNRVKQSVSKENVSKRKLFKQDSLASFSTHEKSSNSMQLKIRKRKLFKQESGSIRDSLASFSTHEKSANSMQFSSSRRSSRRLRRQGSRLSLALSNAQSSKSPYETPIENRSLVDGRQQNETNSIDHGGQLVRWDTDKEAKFPSVPDTEEMTEALERSELFHDTLAAFSSLENIDFLKDFPFRKSTKVPQALAALMWRQLVANWKHSESCKAMLTKPSSIHLPRQTMDAEFYDFDDDLSSSVSTIRFRLNSRNVVLPNFFLAADSYSSLRCLNDDNGYDVLNNGTLVLSRFLCDVGPGLSSSASGCTKAKGGYLLRHDLSTTLESDANAGALNITEIQTEAKKLLANFERVIDRIAEYSAQNVSAPTDTECDDITYSCGVKDYASIRNKARRKYGGDVSQVKDVLRGQITFPDEGSLVCGLSSLYENAENGDGAKKIDVTQSSVSFQIVRLKNLFRTTGATEGISNALPTGYRHILLNIKFDCGLIAGKCFPRVRKRFYARSFTHGCFFYRTPISTCTAF